MIIGIGTDIVEIERLAQSLERVTAHCFTPAETAYCDKFRDLAVHYAGRWAAKEAFAKALGTGFGGGSAGACHWRNLFSDTSDQNSVCCCGS